MGLGSHYARLSKRAKVAIACGSLLATYALLGFVVLPAVIRWKLPSILHDSTGRNARIEHVRLNPFALSLTARGFALDDLDGRPLAAFDELYVNFELSSLYRRAFTFDEIALRAPALHLNVLADGHLSIADLIEGGEDVAVEPDPAENAEEQPAGIVPLIVHSLHIDQGRFAFTDDAKQPAFALEVGPIDVNLRDFATIDESGAPYRFNAVTADGQSLAWEGEISASPLRSSGRLAVTGIRPRNAWSYFRDRLAIEVEGGTVDVSGGYRFEAGDGELVLTLDDGAAAVHDLEIVTAGGGEPVLSLPGLQVAGVSFDLGAQTVHVGSITSSGARLDCALEADGAFSYARLFAVGDASADGSTDETDNVEDTGAAVEPTPPWNVVVDTVVVDGVSIGFSDRTTEPPVALSLHDLALRLDAVTTSPGAEIGLSLETSLGRTGRIRASGKAVLEPLNLGLDLDLSAIELAAFQPYVDPIANVEIVRGGLRLKGALSYRAEHGSSPMLSYQGGLAVDDLATKDRALGDDLVAWTGLRLEGIELDVEPTSARVQTIAFAQPRVRLVVAENGTVNVANLAADAKTAEPADAAQETTVDTPTERAAGGASGGSVPISVGSFEIDGGAIAIVDRSVRPPFRMDVDELKGSIRDISSDPTSRSTVDVRADVGGGASIAISGKSNLLAADAFTDLTFSLRDVGMTDFSPYSGKYVGRAIEKGKLSVDLAYKLDQSRLVGSNELRIDQFDFGRNVDSADATSLPVGLAVALLRDTSGRIKIDLPVSGNVDDPEFSLGGLLLGAFVNLVTKAAASPFAIIGGIVGLDAEDLEFVAFPAGGAELTSAEQAKLDALAQALADRPSLRLEIQGVAAPAADAPALRERELEARLRAARFEEIRGKRDAPSTADEVVLDDEQRFDQLERAYRETFDRKPKTLLDEMPAPASGTEPVDEEEWLREQMRLRLLETIVVEQDDLRDLANRRSGAIRGYLTDTGTVAPERVFLRDGNLSETVTGDQVRSKLALAAN